MRARSAAAQHRADHAFSSAEALIESGAVDAIVAACPPQAHEILAEKAIASGMPIFVEKPPAVSTERVAAIGQQAEHARVTTGVGMNFRYASAYLALKMVLEHEDVGAIVSVDIEHVASKPRKPLWGLSVARSFLLAQAIHPLDLAIDLCGPLEAVTATGRADSLGVQLALGLRFGNAVGTVSTGTYSPRFSSVIQVHCARGAVLRLERLAHLTAAGLPSISQVEASLPWRLSWEPSPLESGYARAGFATELRVFLECVRTGDEFSPSIGGLLATYRAIVEIEGGLVEQAAR